MNVKTYQVRELARVARVTVRTLHYYHELGLLVPSGRTAAGYRLYNGDDLLRLQQILIGRELGLPLAEIRRMLDHPKFDHRKALLRQRERLRQRARDTEAVLGSIDAALEALERRNKMDATKLFEGFDHTQYEDEAKEKWGETEAYAISAKRTARYGNAELARAKAEAYEVMQAMAAVMQNDGTAGAADSEEAMEVAERHRLHIDHWFYPCSRAMHAGLAEMYEADERFADTFEAIAEGLATFFADAVRANAKRQGPPPAP